MIQKLSDIQNITRENTLKFMQLEITSFSILKKIYVRDDRDRIKLFICRDANLTLSFSLLNKINNMSFPTKRMIMI